jgi:ribosomal protein S18 acetylase RimI-like enzyme
MATCFGYEDAHNEPSLSIARKLAVDDGLFFVATEDSRLVGTLMAGYDGHRGWLYAVAVHPKLRGSGLGTKLVQTAEGALAASGCVKINLQLLASNQSTAAFYKSLGYTLEPRQSMGKLLLGNIPPNKLIN